MYQSMKTRLNLTCVAVCCAALMLLSAATVTQATLFAYNGYAILNNNGAGNVYYDLDTPTANPDFAGTTFTVTAGQTLRLGAQVSTDPGNSQPSSWGAEWARIYYRIDGGTFASLNLPVSTGPTGDWFERFEEANTANMVNLANSLSVGTHSLSIYIQAHDDTQPADGYVSNGGLNFNATIAVVPEPANVALGMFGGLCLTAVVISYRRKSQPVYQSV